MKKELRFTARIDTAEFDRTVDNMQKKLKEAYGNASTSRATVETKSRLSAAGLGPAPSPQERAKADQDDKRSRQDLDRFIKQQVKDQEGISKAMAKQLELTKALKKEQDSSLKGSREEREAREKLLKTEEQIAKLRGQSEAKGMGINQALAHRQQLGTGPQGFDRIQQAYSMGGIGGAGRAAMRMPGFMASMAGGAMGMGGALLGAGAEFNDILGAVPRGIAAAQGNTGSIQGQFATGAINRQSFRNQYFSPERIKAKQMSEDETASKRRGDNMRIGGTALGIAGGIAGTIATGGMLPIAMGVGAAAYGGYQAVTNDQFRDRLSGMFGNTEAQKRYDTRLKSEESTNFQSNYTNLIERDPVKKAMMERYQNEMMPNLQSQRQLGLNDKEMEGFLMGGTEAGFTTDLTRQASQNIIGAGGSTRAARGSASFANTLERDRGLTNASSVMGRLSGTLGSSEATQSATIKLLSEGVRLGLDKSEFAEENRKFTQMAADAIVRSGTTTIAGAESVGAGFSRFVQDKTTQGLEGAQGAYQMTQGLTSQAGGARGAIQAAALAKDPQLNKLSRDQRSLLLSMSEEKIRAGGFEIEAMAQEAGIPLKEFQSKVLQVKEQAISPRADVDKMRDQLRVMAKGKTDEELKQDKVFQKLKGDYGAGLSTTTEGYANKPLQERESFVMGNIRGMDVAAASGDFVRAPGKSGKLADQKIAADAADDQAYLTALRTFTPAMEKATQGVSEFATAMVQAAQEMRTAFDDTGKRIIPKSGAMGTVEWINGKPVMPGTTQPKPTNPR